MDYQQSSKRIKSSDGSPMHPRNAPHPNIPLFHGPYQTGAGAGGAPNGRYVTQRLLL